MWEPGNLLANLEEEKTPHSHQLFFIQYCTRGKFRGGRTYVIMQEKNLRDTKALSASKKNLK